VIVGDEITNSKEVTQKKSSGFVVDHFIQKNASVYSSLDRRPVERIFFQLKPDKTMLVPM
jgi:hypothetical protein